MRLGRESHYEKVTDGYRLVIDRERWAATRRSMVFSTGDRVSVHHQPQKLGNVVLASRVKPEPGKRLKLAGMLPVRFDDGTCKLVPIGCACVINES